MFTKVRDIGIVIALVAAWDQPGAPQVFNIAVQFGVVYLDYCKELKSTGKPRLKYGDLDVGVDPSSWPRVLMANFCHLGHVVFLVVSPSGRT